MEPHEQTPEERDYLARRERIERGYRNAAKDSDFFIALDASDGSPRRFGNIARRNAHLRQEFEKALEEMFTGHVISQRVDLAHDFKPDNGAESLRLIGLLAEGGTSFVFSAKRKSEPYDVIVKIERRLLELGNPGAKDFIDAHPDAFERESRIHSCVNSPHVVRFYGSGVGAGRRYQVVEYVNAPTLDDMLDWAGGGGEMLEAKHYSPALIARSAMLGLRDVHAAGVLHRDFKPLNLLVTRDSSAKICDFGAAAMLGDDGVYDGLTRGSRYYSAPELLHNADLCRQRCWELSHRPEDAPKSTSYSADIYSLGLVLAQLLSPRDLRFLFPTDKQLQGARWCEGLGQSATEFVEAPYKNIVANCLRYEARDRYQSVEDVLADFDSARRADTVRSVLDPANILPSSLLAYGTGAVLPAALAAAPLSWPLYTLRRILRSAR